MHNDWTVFFSVIAGTAGVMLGLLFVGLSMNVDRIASSRILRTAALQPMLLLLGLLITSILFLVPGQPLVALGLETMVIGSVFALVGYYDEKVAYAKHRVTREVSRATHARINFNIFLNLVPFVLIVTSGVLLTFGRTAGMYGIVAGVVLALIQVATMAWALVVDIHSRQWWREKSGSPGEGS
ncbi:MAG: hypothetical protein LBG44_02755 [Gemmatimonadota bacterium]|jgi:hypothetical protein|nr:hypothetical protein [Gemmatimonadota bacterium]